MFVVEDVQKQKAPDEPKRIIDYDRDVWLQVIIRGGPTTRVAFKLVWRKKVIPFTAEWYAGLPPDFKIHRDKNLHWKIAPNADQPFGVSVLANSAGVPNFLFESEAERDEAAQLAVEALFEYGSAYNGKRQRDHGTTMTFAYKGRIYSWSDFKRADE